jgi:hypothetical protein
MQPTAIFWPMIAHFVLVVIVYCMLGLRRREAVRKGEAKVSQFRMRGDEPPTSATASANIMNQFELPMLFHVVCLALFVTAGVSFLSVTLAWVFVALRYVHAWLHLAGRLARHRRVHAQLLRLDAHRGGGRGRRAAREDRLERQLVGPPPGLGTRARGRGRQCALAREEVLAQPVERIVGLGTTAGGRRQGRLGSRLLRLRGPIGGSLRRRGLDIQATELLHVELIGTRNGWHGRGLLRHVIGRRRGRAG